MSECNSTKLDGELWRLFISCLALVNECVERAATPGQVFEMIEEKIEAMNLQVGYQATSHDIWLLTLYCDEEFLEEHLDHFIKTDVALPSRWDQLSCTMWKILCKIDRRYNTVRLMYV